MYLEKQNNYMLPSLKNQAIFVNPIPLGFGMEIQDDELTAVVKERIRQLESGEVEAVPNENVFAEISECYGF